MNWFKHKSREDKINEAEQTIAGLTQRVAAARYVIDTSNKVGGGLVDDLLESEQQLGEWKEYLRQLTAASIQA
jgi:hypothetical protein